MKQIFSVSYLSVLMTQRLELDILDSADAGVLALWLERHTRPEEFLLAYRRGSVAERRRVERGLDRANPAVFSEGFEEALLQLAEEEAFRTLARNSGLPFRFARSLSQQLLGHFREAIGRHEYEQVRFAVGRLRHLARIPGVLPKEEQQEVVRFATQPKREREGEGERIPDERATLVAAIYALDLPLVEEKGQAPLWRAIESRTRDLVVLQTLGRDSEEREVMERLARRPDAPVSWMRTLVYEARHEQRAWPTIAARAEARADPDLWRRFMQAGNTDTQEILARSERGERGREAFRRLVARSRRRAAEVLRSLPAGALQREDLLRLLSSSDPEVRLAAITEMGRVCGEMAPATAPPAAGQERGR